MCAGILWCRLAVFPGMMSVTCKTCFLIYTDTYGACIVQWAQLLSFPASFSWTVWVTWYEVTEICYINECKIKRGFNVGMYRHVRTKRRFVFDHHSSTTLKSCRSKVVIYFCWLTLIGQMGVFHRCSEFQSEMLFHFLCFTNHLEM